MLVKTLGKVVGEFKKNRNEKVIVKVDKFGNHRVLDLRVYAENDEGKFKPTYKGISISVDKYFNLKDLINKAEPFIFEQLELDGWEIQK